MSDSGSQKIEDSNDKKLEAVYTEEKKPHESFRILAEGLNCESNDTHTAIALNSMMAVFGEKEGILAQNRQLKADRKALMSENATLRLQLRAHTNLEVT